MTPEELLKAAQEADAPPKTKTRGRRSSGKAEAVRVLSKKGWSPCEIAHWLIANGEYDKEEYRRASAYVYSIKSRPIVNPD